VGEDAQAAAEDQRVGRIAGIVEDRAVDGGDAHLVAVVLDSGSHAVSDVSGMQHPGRQFLEGQVGRTEAQHVGIGNRPRADADDVAHHAAHACVRAAEGLERGGVVVGLHLESQVRVLVEGDDACIIDKGRAYPGLAGPFGRRANIGLQQRVDTAHCRGLTAIRRAFLVIDECAEGLVDAMLGPGLRQHLELDIYGLAALPAIVVLNGAHLGQVERQATLPADGFEARGIGSRQRDEFHGVVCRLQEGEGRCDPAVDRVGLDDGIGEQGAQARQCTGPQPAGYLVALARRSARQSGDAGDARAFQQILGHAVRDAGVEHNFDRLMADRLGL